MRNALLKIIGVGFVLGLIGLWLLQQAINEMQRAPEFYNEALEISPDTAFRVTKELKAGTEVVKAKIDAGEPWELVLTEERINAWFAYDLANIMAQRGIDQVSDPRAKIEAEGVTVACQWHASAFSGVLVLQAKLSLDADQEKLTIELGQIRSGWFTVSRDQWEEQARATTAKLKLPVSWEADGNTTRVVVDLSDIKTAQGHTVVVEALIVEDGVITLRGSSRGT